MSTANLSVSGGPRLCPACQNITLETLREGELEIDNCPQCFGLWFDAEELRRFLPSPSLAEKILSQDRCAEILRGEPRPEQETRDCPHCSIPLRESPVGSVHVDVCFRCRGIWLDHGELSRLLSRYQVGERGNMLVLNQIAEGLREIQKRGQPRA